jgi:hypothetical protein
MLGLRSIAVCALLTMSAIAFAQTSDTTPPELLEFDFNPKAIDVTSLAQSVTITARVTDDLAGASSLRVIFRSPTGAQFHRAFFGQTGGTLLDATYSGTLEIPLYVESGTWVADVRVLDRVGNSVFLDSSDLAFLGFPTELDVVSIPDTTPPSIVSAAFSSAAIDVSASDQTVTLDLSLADDLSGVDFDGSPLYYIAYLRGPTVGQNYAIPYRDFIPVSGIPDTWQLSWTIPQHSEAGTWTFQLDIADNAGNRIFLQSAASFDVVSTAVDLTPPVLTGFRFTPAVINTSLGSASVTIELDLTDDLTGVDFSLASLYGGFFHGAYFRSPSFVQLRSACCSGFSMTAGTVLDGTWQANIFFPQYSEAGTWKPTLSGVTDHVRNRLFMSPAALEAGLFPTNLVVVRPSLGGDAIVGSGGGTVTDETFGDRAQIIFPAGAVASDTVVAIDVLPDPLAVPTPVGYLGPATFFVNINLIPEPTFPFPAPGVTLTLPLTDFLKPGTGFPLFSVDNATGLLVPVPDVTTGFPVFGTVNADGLSITFSGVSHLSILVGLIPDVIPVSVDIKPDSDPNPVNTGSNGVIPVAILSVDGFDAAQVDPLSVEFGPDGATEAHGRGHVEDVDGDGDLDLVLHFKMQQTGISCGDTNSSLTGQTISGDAIEGTDSVNIVDC